MLNSSNNLFLKLDIATAIPASKINYLIGVELDIASAIPSSSFNLNKLKSVLILSLKNITRIIFYWNSLQIVHV